MATKPVILWFRRDLRLHDNPALNHAAETGRPILPVYILDEHFERPMGAASRWWLDKSLRALDAALQYRGSRLILRKGNALSQLQALIADTGAEVVFMNRLFEPAAFETTPRSRMRSRRTASNAVALMAPCSAALARC